MTENSGGETENAWRGAVWEMIKELEEFRYAE